MPCRPRVPSAASCWLLAVLLLAGSLSGCGFEGTLPELVDPAEDASRESEDEPAPELSWEERDVVVAAGDTIAKILQDQGLSYSESLELVGTGKGIHDLEKIRIGETLTFRHRKEDGSFFGLVYPLDRYGEANLVLRRGPKGGFMARKEYRETEVVLVGLSGTIESSLWAAKDALDLSAENIVGLASIFEWEIDFNTQVRSGDRFRLLLEDVRDARSKEHLRYGTILAAEYVNQGQRFLGVRFEDGEGKVGYFNEEGMSTKKMFLKSPLKFSRISSRFQRKRYHPVLKKWRAHRGIDYAAGRGTPVRAIGRGKVIISGRKGGYGKHVRVRHSGKFGSSYSHLNTIRVRNGQWVEQGQIVGTVGSTGLATGPHLHFEFYVGGSFVDFLSQKFPRTEPIDKKERPAFEAERDRLLPQLLGLAPSDLD